MTVYFLADAGDAQEWGTPAEEQVLDEMGAVYKISIKHNDLYLSRFDIKLLQSIVSLLPYSGIYIHR